MSVKSKKKPEQGKANMQEALDLTYKLFASNMYPVMVSRIFDAFRANYPNHPVTQQFNRFPYCSAPAGFTSAIKKDSRFKRSTQGRNVYYQVVN